MSEEEFREKHLKETGVELPPLPPGHWFYMSAAFGVWPDELLDENGNPPDYSFPE